MNFSSAGRTTNLSTNPPSSNAIRSNVCRPAVRWMPGDASCQCQVLNTSSESENIPISLPSICIPVELPRAAKNNTDTLKTEVIEIARSGKLYLNGKAVGRDDLRRSLNTRDRKNPVVILDEAGREVTSFVKEKMKTFEQVLKYMRNVGYEIVH